MSITLSRKGIAIAVAAGLVTVGAVGSVSYAAGTSAKGVTACANGKGRLALTNSKNKCAKGYKKVSIAKQGPRGATGKTGATGKQGVAGKQGPGTVTYRQTAFFASSGDPVTVGGYTYSSTCTVTGTGNSRVVTTVLTVAAPSGQTVGLDGVAFGGPDNNQSGSVVDTPRAATASTQVLANNQQAVTSRSSSMLVIGATKNQLVTYKLFANPADAGQFNPFPLRCSVEAVVTPAG